MKVKKKILIPGGTGFIGYHLCKFFVKKKWIVHSISQSKPKEGRKVKNVKYFLSDVYNIKKLKKILNNDYDYVVNLSGYVDHGKNKSIKKTHFYGCKNLVKILDKKKLKKFVQIGSSIEYGNSKSPQSEITIENKIDTKSEYGNSKLLSTFYLKKLFNSKKIPIVILRLYLVYGPNQDTNRVIPFVIDNCLKDDKFNCSPGTQYRDFTYIDDIVSAVYKSLKNKNVNGEILNIGFGRPTKVKNLINKIVKLSKKGKPIFSKLKFRNDEIQRLYPSIKKAKKLMNWSPKVSLDLGLKKTIKFYKNEKNKYNY